MLVLILMLLLGAIILGGFLFSLSYFSVGFMGLLRAKAAKSNGEQMRPMLPREKREARIRYLDSLLADASERQASADNDLTEKQRGE